MKRHVSELAKGFFAGLCLCGLLAGAFFAYRAATIPIPYRDVFITEQKRNGEWLYVTATFIKTGCEFVKLNAIGHELGETFLLPWADREAGDGDRIRGLHTLRINIETLADLDAIELRTRHDCPGVGDVDRTFAWLDPDETITPDNPQAGHRGHLAPVH